MTSTNDEESDEDMHLDLFFTCEDYVEKTWIFDDYIQRLFCSNMAVTAHDLTGQIVWPASEILSWFVARNKASFENKTVLELGAGCGLAGFVASNFCKKVIITDGNDVVLRLLNKNKDELNLSNNIFVDKLLWGIKSEISQFGQESNVPDVIIGADVILWPAYVLPLLLTVKWLLMLSKTKNGICFISYIVRANSTTTLLHETCEELYLHIQEIPVESFLPDPLPKNMEQLEKRFFKISLHVHTVFRGFENPLEKDTNPLESEEATKEEEQINRSLRLLSLNSAPC